MVTVLDRENSSQDLERNIKVQEYLDYINEHIQNVVLMFNRDFYPFLANEDKIIPNEYFNKDEFKAAIEELAGEINNHDASKYSEEEFSAYRRHFHPTKAEEAEEDQQTQRDEFEAAWEHHYTSNPHHPQYWLNKDTGVSTDMSLRAIIEMICDWNAMSYKFHQNTIDWYESKADKEKKAMTDRTKAITEFILYKLIPPYVYDTSLPNHS